MQTDLATITNGVDVTRLNETVTAVKAAPELGSFRFRIQNRWIDCGENRSEVQSFSAGGKEIRRKSGFVLTADEPDVLLGTDTAANPVEHLLHALASCVTTSMVYHAAARGIHIEEVESTLEGDIDLHGFLDLDKNVRKGYEGIRVTFKVKADVPEEQLQDIVELGTGHSPVFDSLLKGVPLSVKAERL